MGSIVQKARGRRNGSTLNIAYITCEHILEFEYTLTNFFEINFCLKIMNISLYHWKFQISLATCNKKYF